jgi:hypothetical protein
MQEAIGLSTTTGKYRFIVRLFGGLNLVLCLIGLLLEPLMLIGFLRGRSVLGVSPTTPFYVVTAVSVGLLSALLMGSIYLIRLQRRGLAICAFAFLAELVYGFVLTVGWLHLTRETAALSALEKSFQAAIDMGNLGMTPQLYIVYPIIGLSAALFLARKSKQIQWRTS